jgi:DNA-binding NarL/FixJ family response regulator
MTDGASNKEISLKLSVAESTVEKHLERIYEKLEVAVRAKAVIWGIENCMDFPY